MRKLHYLIASGLGSGMVPVAPGTSGTILAWLIAWFLLPNAPMALIGLTLITFAIGVWSSTEVEKDLKSTDPGLVVVDEMVGMWLSLWFIPHNIWLFLIAFGLFRLFDIWKPYPVNWLQDLHGGWGIMLDDVGAGAYALAITHLIGWFWF